MDLRDPGAADHARQLVDAILTVPGIASVEPGRYGQNALFYPGRRVHGLRLNGEELEVHVVVDLSAVPDSLPVLADDVRRQLTDHVPYSVTVVLADATYQEH